MLNPVAQLPKSDQQIQNEAILGQSEMGSLLVEGYQTALRLDPRLAEIKVVPIVGETHQAGFARANWEPSNQSGKHEIHIRTGDLGKVLGRNSELMRKIPSTYGLIAQRLGITLDQATPRLMYANGIFHEMGHARQYFDHENDPVAYKSMKKREKLALPLGNITASAVITPGTPARNFVDANWDRLHERLGTKTLEELVHLQAVAYRNMTAEAGADKFASEVFRANPALFDELLSEPAA